MSIQVHAVHDSGRKIQVHVIADRANKREGRTYRVELRNDYTHEHATVLLSPVEMRALREELDRAIQTAEATRCSPGDEVA